MPSSTSADARFGARLPFAGMSASWSIPDIREEDCRLHNIFQSHPGILQNLAKILKTDPHLRLDSFRDTSIRAPSNLAGDINDTCGGNPAGL
jgi:hypothetical protein